MKPSRVPELYEGSKPGSCIVCSRYLKPRAGSGRQRRMCLGECTRQYRILIRQCIHAEQRAADEVPRAWRKTSRLVDRACQRFLNTEQRK